MTGPVPGRAWSIALCLATLVIAAAAPAQAQVNTVRYACNDGTQFGASFDLAADTLTLDFSGGFRLVLAPAPTGSGMRYTGGGFEFRGKGPEATLDRPGQPALACREIAGARETQQQGAPKQASGPSFDCSGSLNVSERRICASPDLAGLDRKMADTYAWLQGQLSEARRAELARDQRQWLARRNACGANDHCLHGEILERTGYLNEYLAGDAPAGGGGGFPFAAKSWGGIVRSGPGQQFAKAASLAEGEPITVIERMPETFQGRPWFRIQFRGRTGYHWGGIICPIGQPVDGTFQVCN